MPRLFLQILAVAKINILSMPGRLGMTLSAMIAVAMVVFIFLGALALQNGFVEVAKSSGSPDIALALREGSGHESNSVIMADQIRLMEQAPGVKMRRGSPLTSPELSVIVDGIRKSTGDPNNIQLRGLKLEALHARQGVRITQGRMFTPGSNEMVVGRGVQNVFEGFELNKTVTLGNSRWKVVGVFSAEGSVFDSELWADLRVVQSLFNRGSSVNSIRLRLDGPEALEKMQNFADKDPRLNLEIKTEKDYFSKESEQSSNLMNYIGMPLSILMSIGALAGAINAMYASVDSRVREIVTLRIIGFGRVPVFLGTMIESLVLTLSGVVIGAILAWLYFNGVSASTLSSNFTQLVFQLKLDLGQYAAAITLGTILGLLGGLAPAWRASTRPILKTQ